jgi:hypothetical protein
LIEPERVLPPQGKPRWKAEALHSPLAKGLLKAFWGLRMMPQLPQLKPHGNWKRLLKGPLQHPQVGVLLAAL